jgi:hypothetical protein
LRTAEQNPNIQAWVLSSLQVMIWSHGFAKKGIRMKRIKQTPGRTKESLQAWEIINPAGTIEMKAAKLAPRLDTLEGKTVLLRWNFKHNGNHYLDRISELLAEKVPSAKVIKVYETDRSTINQSGSIQDSARLAKGIAALKPDLVIGAHGD